MKTSTLHSLITARALHDEAHRLIDADDRYMSSAGLILLQDALELVFLAMLVESNVDEEKSLESKSFDELIGEIRKIGIKVPKSSTLKALNKQRVIIKHYGQLAEPLTVRTYAEAAEIAFEAVVRAVLGRNYRDILLTDILNESEAKSFLVHAANYFKQEKFLEVLIEVRKAIFVEIEAEYCIHSWEDVKRGEGLGLMMLSLGGFKAPYYTKNQEWIKKNVNTPFDYIQIDYENLRVDAMEWGVNTAELYNIRRLTPEVFRKEKGGDWKVRYDLEFPSNEANVSNARYCLDRAISIILRKQQHKIAGRYPSQDFRSELPPVYIGASVYSKAKKDSDIVHVVNDEFQYRLSALVSGFDLNEKYYAIDGNRTNKGAGLGGGWFRGFLLKEDED